jgi:hypothetical protein
LLHIDFAFWDVPSRRGFTTMLVIIDNKTSKLWVFCTASNTIPLHILRWFFSNLRRERVQVDKDGALIGSSAFCHYILDEEGLILEHTGCYASYLNGKVEPPNQTIAERARCVIMNVDRPKIDWCYAVEHCADLYFVSLHSVIYMSPDEGLYRTKALYKYMHLWGCQILFPSHDITKRNYRADEGYFYGYAKSRALLCWFDDKTKNVKHAHGSRLLELDPLVIAPTPGRQLLKLEMDYKEGDIDTPLHQRW